MFTVGAGTGSCPQPGCWSRHRVLPATQDQCSWSKITGIATSQPFTVGAGTGSCPQPGLNVASRIFSHLTSPPALEYSSPPSVPGSCTPHLDPSPHHLYLDFTPHILTLRLIRRPWIPSPSPTPPEPSSQPCCSHHIHPPSGGVPSPPFPA